MPSLSRLQAIGVISARPPLVVAPASELKDLWARDVFTLEKMKSALPKEVFKSIQRSMVEGTKLDATVANVVAQAMKDWATNRGALYYAHVFYPLTN
ncbi:MAG: glutamine synthetase III, partial [Prochlorococcaceae cyanobacterium]